MDTREVHFFLNAAAMLSAGQQNAMLIEAGDATRLLDSRPECLEKSLYEAWLRAIEKLKKEKVYERLCDDGVSIVTRDDEIYPPGIRYVQDAPHMLYVRGKLDVQTCRGVAIIGSRKASLYGRSQAQRFASALCEAGFAVISGLARGIDSVALETAVKVGGQVVAVLGTGIDQTYPPENANLFAEVAKSGAIVSEYPPGAKPLARHFPWRNRIISGWGLGVFVVEANLKSGSLVTARWGLDQGKDIFALPGIVGKDSSRGCHKLIKEGAYLVEDPEDIINHYEHLVVEQKKTQVKKVSKTVDQLLGLSNKPQSLEELLEVNDLSESELTRELMMAVAKGQAKKLPGAQYVLR